MNLDKEFQWLSEYLHEYIQRLKPVSLEHQIKVYSQKGFIDEGGTRTSLPSFYQWKQIYKSAQTGGEQ